MSNSKFTPTWLVVHHSATDKDAELSDIRQGHLNRGWDDIGYHWLIDNKGLLHKGRSEEVPGAHVLGFNQESIAVCLVGNFEKDEPSPLAQDTLTRLLYVLAKQYSIDPGRIIGHLESPTKPTTLCPGAKLIKLLPEIRNILMHRLDMPIAAIDREIFISKFVNNQGALCLSGFVYNVGFESWGTSLGVDNDRWKLGLKLHQANILSLESHFPILKLPVNPNSRAEFELSVKLGSKINKGAILELDLVYETRFWGTDLGLSQQLFNVEQLSLESNLNKDALIKVSSIKQIGNSFLQINGRIKNISKYYWQPNQSLTLTTEVGTPSGDVVSETTAADLKSKIVPGGHHKFSILVEVCNLSTRSPLTLSVALGTPAKQIGYAQHSILFPLIKYPQHATPYNATFSDLQIKVLHGFIITITGKAINSGLLPWDNTTQSDQNKFRLGARLLTKSTPVASIWETRFELPSDYVAPGESFNFHFNASVVGAPSGDYLLEIDPVKETEFWFQKFTKVSYRTQVELKPPPIQAKIHNSFEHKLTKPPTAKGIKIAVISPNLPLFDREAGGARLIELLQILSRLECHISFAYESPGSKSPNIYLERLAKMGIFCALSPIDLLSSNQFDVVILCWPDLASQLMPVVRKLQPSARIIVDSVDVHWKRKERGLQSGELNSTADKIAAEKKTEIDTYSQADLVWVVSQEDAETIRNELPSCQIAIVPHLSIERANASTLPIGDSLLFVGGFRHDPNISAALWAIEICKTYRKKTGKQVALYIIGTDPPESIKMQHDGKNTIVTGHVNDLGPFYAKARALIAPLKYGSGIKGKICDAICAGINVITTDIGNEGLNFNNNIDAWIANSTEEFVAGIETALATNENQLRSMNRLARSRVLSLTGRDSAVDIVKYSLSTKRVTICIVTFNKQNLLEICLESILSKTCFPNYQIAVVSNGCTDGTKEYLEKITARHPDKVLVFFNSTNEFFVRPNNFLISKFKSDDIVLINNDIEIIDPFWLLNLQQAAYCSNSIGAAGGMILSPDGTVLEAGSNVQSNGYGTNFGRGSPASSPALQRFRFVGYASGCMLYMKRSAINLCGLLDEDFHPMYFEDAAWQYNLHRHGLKTIYTPLSRAVHREGSTSGTDTKKGSKKFQETNRNKFLSKFSAKDLCQE